MEVRAILALMLQQMARYGHAFVANVRGADLGLLPLLLQRPPPPPRLLQRLNLRANIGVGLKATVMGIAGHKSVSAKEFPIRSLETRLNVAASDLAAVNSREQLNKSSLVG